MPFIVLDYETRSRADLKKVGAWEYSMHPSTRILCAAWRISDTKEGLRTAPVRCWSPALNKLPPMELINALSIPAFTLVAHNAFFEQCITRNVLSRTYGPFKDGEPEKNLLKYISPEQWVCTASLARAIAIPGNLAGAGEALDLPVKKDMGGHKLMMKLSKPRKATKHDKRPWHNDREDLKRVMEYCKVDVEAETLLFLAAPPLNPTERKVWELDQKMNLRGFAVDRKMIESCLELLKLEGVRHLEEIKTLTHGLVETPGQRDRILKYLRESGMNLPDLKAKTVADILKVGGLTKEQERILKLRQIASKTSTAKYLAFDMRSRSDGRVRESQIYHVATTGRWGGAGVQPHNMPRGSIADTDTAAELLRGKDVETLRLLYGEIMDVFSSCLRSLIVPTEGKEFFCADFASIETHVLFWVAKHEEGLKHLREKQDLYKLMAAVIYDVPVDQVTKAQREVGKRVILGCGYGMGHVKFAQTCEQFGVEIDEELAARAVKIYRAHHAPIPLLWSKIEKAAIMAVKHPGKKFSINRTTWFMDMKLPGTRLCCELPSGRLLSYPRPRIVYKPSPWGDKRPVLYHYTVNSLSRKWEEAGTYGGRLVENIIQAIARDLLAEANLRIEKAGYDIMLDVHDEILAEAPKEWGVLKEFEELMSATPLWAGDCPVRVEGWQGMRYKK